MEMYKVGELYPGYQQRPEGTVFDLRDDGAIFIVLFNKPTNDEIKQFQSDSNFEIRFTEIYDEIVLTAKIGGLNWMDTFYNPHLSLNLTKLQEPQDGQGLGLTLMLLDAVDGKIMTMRLLGLSENFTHKFFKSVKDLKEKSFNKETHERNIIKIQKYTTKELVKMCTNYCKFN